MTHLSASRYASSHTHLTHDTPLSLQVCQFTHTSHTTHLTASWYTSSHTNTHLTSSIYASSHTHLTHDTPLSLQVRQLTHTHLTHDTPLSLQVCQFTHTSHTTHLTASWYTSSHTNTHRWISDTAAPVYVLIELEGVHGSCAEYSTVESYTVVICQQSCLILLVFHHPLTLSFHAKV